jgi:hypothetical protein
MLESTKRYRQEYSTNAKESSISVETSEEEEVKSDVHKREASLGSEQATSHTDHALDSSEEVVLVYENKMVAEGDETDESEDGDISECEVVSVASDGSDSSVENRTSESYGLSELLSKTHDEQEVSLVDISGSCEELQHKEVGSASVVGTTENNGSCSSSGDFEKGVSKNYKSKMDNRTHSEVLIRINKEAQSIISTNSKRKVCTSGDLSNEDGLSSSQQQKSTENFADASNRYENIICASTEKGSKESAVSSKICTTRKKLFVTENEGEREDNDFVLHVVPEGGDESNPKKIKLDSPESMKRNYKPDAETLKTNSHSNVKDSTAVPITGNDTEEKSLNGLAIDPKDVTEEEMLEAFVDVLSE